MNPGRKITYGEKREKSFSSVSDMILAAGEKAEMHSIFLSLSILFIISATYFLCFGEGVFFFQENLSLFIFSGEYLASYSAMPGGMLEYIGNFLTQGYFSSLYGSLILSIILVLICLVFTRICRLLSSGPFSLLMALVPSCLLLLMHTRYNFSILNSFGYLLVASYFLVSIVPGKNSRRFFVLALFPVFLYVTGSFAFIFLIMYLMYCIIYAKGKNRYLFPSFLVVIASITFLVFKEVLFFQPGVQYFRYPLPLTDISKVPASYNILLACFIFYPIFLKIVEKLKAGKRYNGLIILATMMIVYPITVFLLFKYYDRNLTQFFRIEKSVFRQDWDSVIRQQESFRSTNSNSQYYYNLALSGKGQLCNRMFFGPQDFGIKSLTLQHDEIQINRSGYFYYIIGLTNEAHHLAYESRVLNGWNPENIKMLIKTELINGNYLIAERYINVLKKILHYRDQAAKYEKMLNNPSLINSDPELKEKISSFPKKDFFINPDDFVNIELILKSDPYNKRAFEYKMAFMLFNKDLKGIVNEANKMKGMGYEYIPRHIEEAILLYIFATHETPDLGGLSISPETDSRFRKYLYVFNNNFRNKQVLEREIKKVGEKTYWYYFQFK